MCELLGVSSLQPVTLEMSLQTLISHANILNPDGWGIVFYEKNDGYVFREPRPAHTSQLTDLVANSDLESQLVVSHIRKATSGGVELQNTHPFTREVGGQLHSFAFNGDIPGIFDSNLARKCYQPIGTTDAEYAFCFLLEMLEHIECSVDAISVIKMFGDKLATLGPANFLYSDSQRLYAYSSYRLGHDGEHFPGLHVIKRQCEYNHEDYPIAGLKLSPTSKTEQQLVLIASVPLSDENWIPLAGCQLMVIERGCVL